MVSATWVDSSTRGAPPAEPARGAITDQLGQFVFDRLAPGTYRLQAMKPGFIDGEYGATAPAGTGTQITVAAGDDVADLILALARGGVITGTLRHINGEPAEGVAVGARTSASARSAIRQVVTDDRGTYRLHGLPPGQYFVVASPQPAPGATPIQVMSTEDVDTALRELEERSRLPGPRSGVVGAARPGAEVQPGAPATFGYAPVFYPGTTNAAEAVSVRVEEGEERSGADFSLVLAGTTSISGVVVGPDGRPNEGAVLSIAPAGFAGGVSPVPRGASQADGTFLIVNTAPGRYVVSARVTPLTLALAAGRPTDVRPGASRASLWAIEEVDVGPTGLAGLTLVLRPSMTLSGRVVFEGEAATPRPPAVRVSLVNAATGSPTLAATASAADGTFEIGGILPGTYTIETRIPGPARWWPHSAVVDGMDLLDFPPTFDAGSIDVTGVVLTLSDRFTELSGTVEVPADPAATDPAVLVFPADRVFWRPRSRRGVVPRDA